MSNNHNLEIVLIGHVQRFGIEELLRQFGAVFTPGDSSAESKEADRKTAEGKGLIIRASLPEAGEKYRIVSMLRDGVVSTSVSLVQDGQIPATYPAGRHQEGLSPGREIKRQMWVCLSEITGMRFPWGSLTGVNPTHIVREIREAEADEDAADTLQHVYGVSGDKAELAVRTAKAEAALLERVASQELSIYLDIPFCPSRCTYCSFSLPEGCGTADRLEDDYIEAVLRELRKRAPELTDTEGRQRKVRTLYVGGGTPAALSAPALERLLPAFLDAFAFTADSELTFEAGRADAIDREKLRIVKEAGFTKLCINPQSLHDETLKRVNRRHTTAELYEAYTAAREAGFKSINMDLIAGLPGEDAGMFEESLNGLIDWGADAITVHTLALKRSSRMHEQTRTGEAAQVRPALAKEDPTVEAMVRYANMKLPEAGFRPYYLYRQKLSRGGLENTGFAKLGHESLYNVAMMSDRRDIIAFGAGASSKRYEDGKCKRSFNKRGIRDYIRHY